MFCYDLLTMFLINFTLGQSNSNQVVGVNINKNIKADVEKNISNSMFGENQDLMFIYDNLIFADFMTMTL